MDPNCGCSTSFVILEKKSLVQLAEIVLKIFFGMFFHPIPVFSNFCISHVDLIPLIFFFH